LVLRAAAVARTCFVVGRRPIVPTGRKLVRVKRAQNAVEIYVCVRRVGGRRRFFFYFPHTFLARSVRAAPRLSACRQHADGGENLRLRSSHLRQAAGAARRGRKLEVSGKSS
jgi:hypothetical protein